MIPPKAAEKCRKRIDRLRTWRHAVLQPVSLEAAETDEHYRTPPEKLKYQPAPLGSRWGRHWGTVWFRGVVTLPKSAKGRRVYYRQESDFERLLFVDGKPFAGMDPYHQEVLLTPKARGGETHALYIEAYAGHPMWEVDAFNPYKKTIHCISGNSEQDPPLPLRASELVLEREHTNALWYEADVLLRTAMMLDVYSLRRARILDTLNIALDITPMEWTDETALEAAARKARRLLAPLLAVRNGATTPTVGVVGHAHIDVGWLWPVRESIRKCGRTFSTALNLMEDYPHLTFQQSQAVLYDMTEKHYPELMARIKKRVREGRWEPNGAMWVEADCNVSGGESLVRQLLEGRKKFLELFGYKGDTLWLPDVFGYSAALPQILKKSGVVNFVTSKINWNDTNHFPYDLFWWRGIDGTEIFTAYISTRSNGYNADIQPEVMKETWDYVQRKENQDAALTSVGWGDGGGGPSREMCERAELLRDLEGCPRVEFTNVSRFLKQLREQDRPLPKWVGELYLEYHRGTYTNQARTKKGNRTTELLLRETELFCAMAMAAGLEYPAAALEQAWRTLLTNQFHDILPGTSIAEVYQVTLQEYAAIRDALEPLRDTAILKLAEGLPLDTEGRSWAVANALSWDREELVLLPGERGAAAVDAEGRTLPTQSTAAGLAVLANTAPLSVTAITVQDKPPLDALLFKVRPRALETPYYLVDFDKAGKITRLYDKPGKREVVRTGGRLNDFYTAEDMPLFWDAWDIDRYYRDTLRPEDRLLSREVVEQGALFLTLRSTWAIGRASQITQDMTFHTRSKRIDFHTTVDWRERHTLLKVGFDLDLHADSWRNEIQFGHVTRPMHANTSWDEARFEVCAHKWVDVSEAGYGVALLNDCKYGHDCLDDRISLTLLKSAKAPDPESDQGEHRFSYALLPHTGGFTVDTVVREAYGLNAPLRALPRKNVATNPAWSAATRLCVVSSPNIVVEAIKKAEGSAAVVVRLYEAGHQRGTVQVAFARPVKKVEDCNLMEESSASMTIMDNAVAFEMQPFEIRTLKVWFK